MPPPDLNEKLGAILAICQKMNSERDLNALLDLIAREATRLLEGDRASIFLFDRERNQLWSKVALGSEEVLRFDARLGIAGNAALTGDTINVRDAYGDPRFYSGIDSKTGYRTRNLLAVAMRNQSGEIIGAFEVLNKREGWFSPRDEHTLAALASHAAIAIETAQLVGELRRNQDELAHQNAHLWREVESKYATHGIIGTGPKIQQVVHLVERIRDSLVNVLITGESGTGKELVAKAVHYTSSRARQAFVALNCAALPETLLESELFGIEKGVATGVAPRPGQFQKAHGGTLFLDEVGDLSLTAQAKILLALQEKVKDYCREMARSAMEFAPGVVRWLAAAPWPGNVRQLRNEVIRLAALARQNVITEEDLWEAIPTPAHDQPPARSTKAASLRKAVENLERRLITEALLGTHNNQQQAARMLGLSRQGLINKMKRYTIAGELGSSAHPTTSS